MTHNYTFYYTGKAYHEGYERIFGNENQDSEKVRRQGIQPKDDQAGTIKKPSRHAKSNKSKAAKRRQGSQRRQAKRRNATERAPGSSTS